MPRTATSTPGIVQNITFENVWGVGQNANFLSGRSPGNTVKGVRMTNVTLVIDRWPSWNYSHPGLFRALFVGQPATVCQSFASAFV